jgi:hypothetical protein
MNMKYMFYAAAAVFSIAWFVGFFMMGAGAAIHTLFIFAMICCLQAVITIPKPKPDPKIR